MKRIGTIGKTVAFTSLAIVTMLLAGCGSGSGNSSGNSKTAGGGSATSAKSVTVHLTGNDQMRYNKTKFTVPAGAKVTLDFAHVGKMPLKVMGHDVVILKKGEDAMKFGKELGKNGNGTIENNDLPPSMMGRVLAHTKLIGGGEKTSITFTAPPAGEYDYLCSFPAHYITMHGVMTVK